MKSYTDLEQSRKLAEILPLGSTDMHYHYDNDFGELESIPTITEEDDHFVLFPKDVRCWSLAVLLDMLKDNIKIEKTQLDQSDIFTYSIIGNGYDYKTYEHEELIDACYEMIVKLHEKNELVL